MTKKIFRSIVLVAVCALLASLLLIMGCLYDYFTGLQSQALRDELTFAASGVSQSGEDYLDTLSSSPYRLPPTARCFMTRRQTPRPWKTTPRAKKSSRR